MSFKISKFRRPYSMAISKKGFISCLTRPSNTELVVVHPERERVLSREIKRLGLKNAKSISINCEDQILLIDDIARALFRLDLDLNIISSLKLPGTKYGVIKSSPNSKEFYIPVLDNSSIIKIDSYATGYSTILDYSEIDTFSNVDTLVALDSNKFLVLDKENSSLFAITVSNGKPKSIKKYLSEGRDGYGKIRRPSDINIVGKYIAVHDNDNYLVQFFDEDINFQFQIGGKGESLNMFDLPVSGFTHKDNLYICDQNNDRIVNLNTTKRKCNIIIEDKFIKGSLSRPSGFSNDEKYIYIADRSNGVIQVFNKNLEFLDILKTNKSLNRPSSLSIINIKHKKIAAIIERKEGSNSALRFFNLSANFEAEEFSVNIDENISLNDPQDMEASSSSMLYIADTLNRKILKVGLDGQLINQADMTEISSNKRILSKCISVREDGEVFTSDFEKCKILHFDSDLSFIQEIDFSNASREIRVIRSVFATMGYLILLTRGKYQFLKVDYEGNIIQKLNFQESGIPLNHPVKIISNTEGSYLIADKENDRVIKIDRDFKFVCSTP